MRRKPIACTPHERYDPSHPLLRELVLIHVDADDGSSFDMLLTRVPGIGELVGREDRSYKVLRVWHEPVDDDGRGRFGWHAFIDVELQPREEAIPRRGKLGEPCEGRSSVDPVSKC